MSGHENEQSHEEDHSICMKVGVFFIAVLVTIILLGVLK